VNVDNPRGARDIIRRCPGLVFELMMFIFQLSDTFTGPIHTYIHSYPYINITVLSSLLMDTCAMKPFALEMGRTFDELSRAIIFRSRLNVRLMIIE